MKYTLIDYLRGEIAYLPIIHHSWPHATYQAMKPLAPPALIDRLNKPQVLQDSEMVPAVQADPAPRSDPQQWQSMADDATPQIEAFLRRFDTGVWQDTIMLHVSRYGTGGSYHTPGESMFQVAAVTIRDSSIGQPMRTFLECLIHESIHLFVEYPVVRPHKLSQSAKEALVDKLCMSNEVTAITGRRYPPQESCVPHLPSNWSQLVRWQIGQQPTW